MIKHVALKQHILQWDGRKPSPDWALLFCRVSECRGGDLLCLTGLSAPLWGPNNPCPTSVNKQSPHSNQSGQRCTPVHLWPLAVPSAPREPRTGCPWRTGPRSRETPWDERTSKLQRLCCLSWKESLLDAAQMFIFKRLDLILQYYNFIFYVCLHTVVAPKLFTLFVLKSSLDPFGYSSGLIHMCVSLRIHLFYYIQMFAYLCILYVRFIFKIHYLFFQHICWMYYLIVAVTFMLMQLFWVIICMCISIFVYVFVCISLL